MPACMSPQRTSINIKLITTEIISGLVTIFKTTCFAVGRTPLPLPYMVKAITAKRFTVGTMTAAATLA